MIRAALVGNCQIAVLRSCLNRSRSVRVTAVLDIAQPGDPASLRKTIDRLTHQTGIDIILSQRIAEITSQLSSKTLAALYAESYIQIPNVYFSGLHPDLTYFGSFGNRISSPVGAYHSKLCLAAFLKGLCVGDCVRLFSEKIYKQLGYFATFQTSLEELRRRDTENHFTITSEFRDLTARELTMLSINHPTPIVFSVLASKILSQLGKPESIPSHLFASYLADTAIWPLYPEIAEYHCLPYRTPYLFYPESQTGARPLNLEEFVGKAYAIYHEHGREELLQMPLAKRLSSLDLD